MTSLCGRILSGLAKCPSRFPIIYKISQRPCYMMNDPLEHATGLEKKMILAEMEGNTDPFDMKVMKRGPGTKDNPNLIPSAFDGRLVGCICEEDQTYIQYMWLTKDAPKRCECGHWFELVEKAPL